LGFGYISKVARDGDQGEDADNNHDNDQFNKSEGFFALIHLDFYINTGWQKLQPKMAPGDGGI
jgi:hypothetical protein